MDWMCVGGLHFFGGEGVGGEGVLDKIVQEVCEDFF